MNKEEIDILYSFANDEDCRHVYDWQGFDYEEICPLIDKLIKENQTLKKQLEELDKKLFFTKNELEMRQKSIDNKLNQQKEFIEYMNKTIEDCNNYSKYIEKKTKELHWRSCSKTYIANEIMKNEAAKKILEEILSKYQEIIGVSHE